MNLFDLQKEFFIISSDNLNSINTKLYGYVIQNDGIIENDSINSLKIPLAGTGAYVYIENTGNDINIYQDFNGSYGVFLFKQGNYFAISNSFMYLVDYVKHKFNLRFNYDFANYMVPLDLCSEAYSDTLIKQIIRLDKDVIVKINVKKKQIDTQYIKYPIRTHTINSQEGIDILDKWFEKWSRLFRVVQSKTDNITICLSGGFDSRVTFCLALMSGMNLNKVRISSAQDDVHKEDFEIASQIADYFHFDLNKWQPLQKTLNFSFQDIMRMAVYNRLPFHKEMHFNFFKNIYKFYLVGGDGGENLRKHWDVPVQDIINGYLKKTADVNNSEIKKSVLKISNDTVRKIKSKYNIKDISSPVISNLLYMNTRSSYHFGSGVVTEFFKNLYTLTPLLDPEILKLKTNDTGCPDNNLLIATIFTRYCPKLLDFKIQGNRFIEKNTIKFAEEINNKYPVDMDCLLSKKHDSEYVINTTDNQLLDVADSNSRIENGYPDKFLKSVFDFEFFEQFIKNHFNDERYEYAKKQSEILKYYPFREIYPLIADAMVLRIIETNRHSWIISLKKYLSKILRFKNN